MKEKVTLGLIGFGVVGSGTVELLRRQKQDIESCVGAPVELKWICSRSRKRSPLIDRGVHQTKDWKVVVADPEVDCVVELMGGTDPAKKVVLSALKHGKHVVTANKSILSEYWNEIFELAHERRRLVYFEAAVGGGVPVVQALNEGLAGNEIYKIVGILNGTTNFILTKMQESNMSFKAALKLAQAAGYTEADPSFDIEGVDAAQKVSILGSVATGQWVPPSQIYSEGISHLQSVDLRLIKDRIHGTIKLLGIAEKTEDGWVFRVHPTLVARTHPFANVRNEYNAIAFHGSAVGDVMLYGKGAGRLPTSSAVISDIIFLSRQIANGTAGQLPYLSRLARKPIKFADMASVQSRYYLRVTTVDRPGVLATITGILGKNQVSIASVHQDTFEDSSYKKSVPITLLTHMTREADIQASVKAINDLSAIKAPTVLLRME
ncbi:MAG: Homoserine dehydrogenase [Elusimicrobia bacterium]|nr:Homoserine dehydrogenase [Elusimicrobiota bacterium]